MIAKNRLKECRTQLGLSQAAVAAKSGASPATVAFIERHNHLPRPETQKRLARALGVAVREVWPKLTSGEE